MRKTHCTEYEGQTMYSGNKPYKKYHFDRKLRRKMTKKDIKRECTKRCMRDRKCKAFEFFNDLKYQNDT